VYSRKLNLLLWAGFHLIIFAVFLFSGPPVVETSLYSILPDTNSDKNLSQIEERISNAVNSNMTVLIGHEDFETLKEISGYFASDLEEIAGIEDLQYEINASSLGQIQQYLHQYRYHFLTPQVRSLLEEGDGSALAERAYFTLSSPVSMGALDYLDEDPFLLAGDAL
jgi:predicted exporter